MWWLRKNRTILRKCTVTAARAQTVDSRPFIFKFFERPGYEANTHTHTHTHTHTAPLHFSAVGSITFFMES